MTCPADAAFVLAPAVDGPVAGTETGSGRFNCGRCGLMDLDAALDALDSGQLAGVELDGFDPRPPEHHALFDRPNVVLTPHLMGLTRRQTAAIFADAARGIADVLAGRPSAGVAYPKWSQAQPLRQD